MYTYDENLFSDLHKDAFGFRPREHAWTEWNEASPAQKQVIWDDLLDALQRTMDWERQQEEHAIADYRKSVQDMLALGAEDEYQARKWLVQGLSPDATDLLYGGEWVCYELRLPFSMKGLFEQICRELRQSSDNKVEE